MDQKRYFLKYIFRYKKISSQNDTLRRDDTEMKHLITRLIDKLKPEICSICFIFAICWAAPLYTAKYIYLIN